MHGNKSMTQIAEIMLFLNGLPLDNNNGGKIIVSNYSFCSGCCQKITWNLVGKNSGRIM